MKAVVAPRYGGPEVLQVTELPLPEPGPGQVRIRVLAAGLNPFDVKLLAGALKPIYTLRFPWVPGHDVCGIVDAVGPGTRHLAAVGQRVYALARLKAAAGQPTAGTLAEYVIVAASDVSVAPVGLSDAEVGALPLVAVAAVRGLRKEGGLKAGQRVLITGGSGGVGHLAVQVAKALGAVVTATCSPAHVAFVKGLGADEVIDYTTTDIVGLGRRFDLVFDCAGVLSYGKASRLLPPDGSFVPTLPSFEIIVRSLLGPLLSNRRCRFMAVNQADEHLKFATSLIETGKVRPHVSATYPMRQAAEAFRALGSGHTVGKVVLVSEW